MLQEILASDAGNKEEKRICVCRYPIFIIDLRDGVGKEIEFYALPVQVIGEEMGGEPFIPRMEIEERESFSGIIGDYMKIIWDDPPKGVKEYDVNGHIVQAGCPVDEHGNVEKCDTKSVFVVYHPLQEWISEHLIELKPRIGKEL